MGTDGGSYLVVGVEEGQFGVAVDRVQTVVEHRPTVPIPGCGSPFLGALNHHGELLPVVPLAALLDRKPQFDPVQSVIAVLEWEDGLVGLLVERSFGLLTSLEKARVAHVLGRWGGPHVLHTLETEGRQVHVLDLDSLLADLAERV